MLSYLLEILTCFLNSLFSLLVVHCFKVEARLKGCKPYKGYRASIYSGAQKFLANYVTDANDSIFYEENDLVVCLLFKTEEAACHFQNELVEMKNNHIIASDMIEVTEQIGRVNYAQDTVFRRVFSAHYKSEDAESPECLTLADLVSIRSTDTEVFQFHIPEVAFQSLEKLDLVTPGTCLYRCHIAGKSKYPRYKDDPNNIIYASWDFHNHFDGLHNASK